MDSTSLLVAATAIGALAFFARTAVLLGREPGGVDSWYYLCYARAFRKAPGLKVGLPQYLLQDQQQSYAPIFPSLLALIPERILARIFWAISPGIDCLTLILLFLLALKLTAAPTVAVIAALAYAVSPDPDLRNAGPLAPQLRGPPPCGEPGAPPSGQHRRTPLDVDHERAPLRRVRLPLLGHRERVLRLRGGSAHPGSR